MVRAMSRACLVALLLSIACSSTTAPPAGEQSPSPGAEAPARPAADPKLLDPYAAEATAPDAFKVKFDTTKGSFVVAVHRDWAPRGADRFFNLVQIGYFTDIAFFRAIDGFMVQFGIHGHPDVARAWKPAQIADDPPQQSNRRGTVSFATSGKNSRTTQLFVNYNDNAPLDGMGFAPIGEVVEGMEVVDALYKGYGEGAPKGNGPDQRAIEREGNEYLRKRFPKLDWITSATVVPG